MQLNQISRGVAECSTGFHLQSLLPPKTYTNR